MAVSYSFPTNIRFGAGVTNEVPDYLKSLRLIRPLVVTDATVSRLPFFEKFISLLTTEGLTVYVFDDIHKNPVKSDVMKGRDAYEYEECDCIIGIGGGAAMDVARAIALSIHHREDLFYYDDLEGGTKYIINDIPHFVTIPTTSGTGSEVGRSAIISEDDSKRKRILFHPTLLAKQVFADPELTYELPPEITAATGMDALTHHVEAFLAKGFHPMADGIALEGIRLIFQSLEKAVYKPDPESRTNMMIASLMGAVAFQKGLGLVHSLAHPLSTLLDMHHGLANAIMLPIGLQFNLQGFEDRYERMAATIGFVNPSAEEFISAVIALNRKLRIPELGNLGVEPKHIEALSALAIKDFCLPSNPKPISQEEIKQLYLKSISTTIIH
ncbi:iron-containing alcohol dehydrogenase [Limibacter armeniacum]|uniref:iron-containing alcohol dehydrogenase n=1 Tax=Limibacter armeniacum TaxID=466084 RepID=UPI002FE58800